MQQKKNLEGQIINFAKEIATCRDDQDTLVKLLKGTHEDLEELADKYNVEINEEVSINDNVYSISQKIEELKEDLKMKILSLKETYNELISGSDNSEKISEIESELSGKESKKEELSQKLKDLRSEISNLKEDLKKLNSKGAETQVLDLIDAVELGIVDVRKHSLLKATKSSGKNVVKEKIKELLGRKKPLATNPEEDSPFYLYGKDGSNIQTSELVKVLAEALLDSPELAAECSQSFDEDGEAYVNGDSHFQINLIPGYAVGQEGNQTYFIKDGVTVPHKKEMSSSSPLQLSNRFSSNDVVNFVKTYKPSLEEVLASKALNVDVDSVENEEKGVKEV